MGCHTVKFNRWLPNNVLGAGVNYIVLFIDRLLLLQAAGRDAKVMSGVSTLAYSASLSINSADCHLTSTPADGIVVGKFSIKPVHIRWKAYFEDHFLYKLGTLMAVGQCHL